MQVPVSGRGCSPELTTKNIQVPRSLIIWNSHTFLFPSFFFFFFFGKDILFTIVTLWRCIVSFSFTEVHNVEEKRLFFFSMLLKWLMCTCLAALEGCTCKI